MLVVDDGSAGGVVQATAREFPAVHCLRWSRPRGFAAAANAGVQAAAAPIVELLNDDTEVTADWAAAALGCFADPTVAAVAPLVLLGSPDSNREPRIDSAGDRYFIGGVAAKRGHGQVVTSEFRKASQVFGASAASAFYRREVFLKLGGFPEHFGSYFEDVDLSFRLNRTSWRVVYQPHSRVWHHGGGSHSRVKRRLLERQSCNEERVFWRNVPSHLFLLALPWHLAVLMGKALRRCQEGTLLPFLLGRLRACTEFASLLAHRRWLARQFSGAGPVDQCLDMRYWADKSSSSLPEPSTTCLPNR